MSSTNLRKLIEFRPTVVASRILTYTETLIYHFLLLPIAHKSRQLTDFDAYLLIQRSLRKNLPFAG
jgi:hypothetical protein